VVARRPPEAGYIHHPGNTPAGIEVYSFDSSAFEKLVNFGESPLWLNDGRRLLEPNRKFRFPAR